MKFLGASKHIRTNPTLLLVFLHSEFCVFFAASCVLAKANDKEAVAGHKLLFGLDEVKFIDENLNCNKK